MELEQKYANRKAVKEEKYDPGYEAVYGGACGENPCNGKPCGFASNGLTANSASLEENQLPATFRTGSGWRSRLQSRSLLLIIVEQESRKKEASVSEDAFQLWLSAAVLMQLSGHRTSVF